MDPLQASPLRKWPGIESDEIAAWQVKSDRPTPVSVNVIAEGQPPAWPVSPMVTMVKEIHALSGHKEPPSPTQKFRSSVKTYSPFGG